MTKADMLLPDRSVAGSRCPDRKCGARFWAIIAKTAMSIGLVFWLIKDRRLNLATFQEIEGRPDTVALFLSVIGLVVLAIAILSWRLQLLLEPQGIYVSFRRCVAVTLIGALFGVVLPGLVAMDVVRAVYLCQDAKGQRSRVIATVLFDRLVGLYGLLVLSSLALIVGHFAGAPRVQSLLGATLLSLTVLGAVVLGLLFVGRRFRLTRTTPRRFAPRLSNLFQAVDCYSSSPTRVCMAIIAAVLSHSLIVFCFFIVGVMLNDTLSLFTHFVINPIAMTANTIPLTPGGLGITESAFSILYEAYDSPNGAAIGLLCRLMQYVVFVAGGIVALLATTLSSALNPNAIEGRRDDSENC